MGQSFGWVESPVGGSDLPCMLPCRCSLRFICLCFLYHSCRGLYLLFLYFPKRSQLCLTCGKCCLKSNTAGRPFYMCNPGCPRLLLCCCNTPLLLLRPCFQVTESFCQILC